METTIYGICGQYGELALALIGVCAAVAALLPAPGEQSGKAYRWIYRIINLIAVNAGHARNATAPKPDSKPHE